MAAGHARHPSVFGPLAVALVASVALVPVLAGCGGSPGNHVTQLGTATTNRSQTGSSITSSAGSPQRQALAYADCMRSNGVANYPDPDSTGNLPKGNAQAFGVSTSQLRAATQACAHLLPSSSSASLTQCLMTGDCPRSVVQPALEAGRKFALCMRSHGVTNWPDPAVDSLGRPSFEVTRAGISIDATRSPKMLSNIGDCQREPGAVLLRQE